MTPLQSQALAEVHEHELVEPVDVGTTGAFASRFPGVVEATGFVFDCRPAVHGSPVGRPRCLTVSTIVLDGCGAGKAAALRM